VHGVNYYLIRYRIKNTVNASAPGRNLLNLNLNGNFWEIPIEHFQARIALPGGVKPQDCRVEYFTGYLGSRNQNLAAYRWLRDSSLLFTSAQPLKPEQGITARIDFPSRGFTYYHPNWLEKRFGSFPLFQDWWFTLLILFPFFFLTYSYWLWNKRGRDPRLDVEVIPEYQPPAGLTPLEMGLVLEDGGYRPSMLAAQIIHLAGRGLLSVEEKAGNLLTGHTLTFNRLVPENAVPTTTAENKIMSALFGGKDTVDSEDLKLKGERIQEAVEKVKKELEKRGLLVKGSRELGCLWRLLGFGFLAYGLVLLLLQRIPEALAITASGLIAFIFAFLLPRRTLEEARLVRQIKGFRLYLKGSTGLPQPQNFPSSRELFDQYLPYAFLFGTAPAWVRSFEGPNDPRQDFNNYSPSWWSSTGHSSPSSLLSAINRIGSEIGSAAEQSSSGDSGSSGGSGGGGCSGGGCGGGGGGGW